VRNANGSVRIVEDGSACRSDETATQWNEQGPEGPQGPQGPPGEGAPGTALPTVMAYLKCKGETQGDIKGGATAKGQEDKIEVFGWSHEIIGPHDAASGQRTGARQHQPLTFTKPIDKASPLLMFALVNNENLTECTLDFVAPDPTVGGEEVYFSIQLENANIVGIAAEQMNFDKETPGPQVNVEHVSLTYQRIAWVWTDGGIWAGDDWRAPAV
jgi:type VI secretion system secreted protein Hcp